MGRDCAWDILLGSWSINFNHPPRCLLWQVLVRTGDYLPVLWGNRVGVARLGVALGYPLDGSWDVGDGLLADLSRIGKTAQGRAVKLPKAVLWLLRCYEL
jgi:hypothetical protein